MKIVLTFLGAFTLAFLACLPLTGCGYPPPPLESVVLRLENGTGFTIIAPTDKAGIIPLAEIKDFLEGL